MEPEQRFILSLLLETAYLIARRSKAYAKAAGAYDIAELITPAQDQLARVVADLLKEGK